MGNFLIRASNNTTILIWGDINGANASFTVPAINSDKHNIKVLGGALDGQIKLIFDGVDLGYKTSVMPDFSGSNYFVGRWASSFFKGQLSNLQIWENGDSTTGTKIMNMAMDERYLNVHGEILYNNSAVVDDWYLSLMNSYVELVTIQLASDFVINFDVSISVFSATNPIMGDKNWRDLIYKARYTNKDKGRIGWWCYIKYNIQY